MGVKGLTITLRVQGLSLKMNIEVSWEKKKRKNLTWKSLLLLWWKFFFDFSYICIFLRNHNKWKEKFHAFLAQFPQTNLFLLFIHRDRMAIWAKQLVLMLHNFQNVNSSTLNFRISMEIFVIIKLCNLPVCNKHVFSHKDFTISKFHWISTAS